MISSAKMVALLAVIVVSLQSVGGQAPDTCTQADVDAEKQFCSNCVQGVECSALDAPPTEIESVECSATRQVCVVLSDVATCVDIGSQTACSCDSKVGCDAFDETMILVCDDAGPSLVYPCPEGETCSDGECAPTPSPETTVDLSSLCTADNQFSYVPVPPECSTAVFCVAEGSTPAAEVNCGSGQYFEPDINDCATAPPVSCSGTCRGNCPDKMDCNRYYVCDGTGTEQDPQNCPAGQYFDAAEQECGTDRSKCSPLTECTFGETTATSGDSTTADSGDSTTVDANESTTSGETTGTVTTKPENCTAENVGSSYPYEGDCKKYWSCRQVSAGSYAYVVGTCLGDLVFNPDTGYCDNASNVDGC